MNRLLHTPEGVRDIYGEERRSKNAISDKMNRTLKLYGYQDIQTPTFEFFDIFNRERGSVPSKNMYKFFDREGNTLVLRPDITPSIARAVAKYYKDETIPLRFSYNGNTFINNFSLQGKMKESTQIGAELIGDGSIDADAEVVALSVNLLLESGLKEFQLDIGHVGFFKALVKEAGLDDEATMELRSLIEIKNTFAVENFIENHPMPSETASLLMKLPEMFGSVDVLEQALSMTSNDEAIRAVNHLIKLYEMIVQYGFEKYVTIDLGMLTEYDYYTGIIFRGYTYGTGDAIVKGGRYDRLIGQFGKDAASIGFAVQLDELLLAITRQHIDMPKADLGTMVLYESSQRTAAIKTAGSLRNLARPVCMIKKDENEPVENYISYCKRYYMDAILYVRDEKTLEKHDINDGSVKVMPVPED